MRPCGPAWHPGRALSHLLPGSPSVRGGSEASRAPVSFPLGQVGSYGGSHGKGLPAQRHLTQSSLEHADLCSFLALLAELRPPASFRFRDGFLPFPPP